ncbi:MAG: tetratricopeptide repeat protein [Taibaiella sp.]|nr:tetratricopeptide repeat protein [Taibaiella sp.]
MSKKQQARSQRPAPAAAATPQEKSVPKAAASGGWKMSMKLKLALILSLVTFAIYFNTLQNGFVLDDSMVYAKNTIVTKGFEGIPELFQTPRLKGFGYLKNENYRPLSLVMFATEVGMFGLNPAVGHFFNIIFFVGCVLALFFFLDKLFEGRRLAVSLIASLLFAVHPIHTEVVSNIKSLDEIFCFLFAFIGLNFFAVYMKKANILHLILGTISIFLSYLSKETVVTFLGIIPIVFFLYLNDDRKRAIFITAGTVVVTGIYLFIRHNILSAYGASTTAVEFIDNALVGAPDMATRLATAMYTMGYYVRLLIVPHPLIDDYGYNSVPYVGFGNIWVLLSVIIYIAAGATGIYRMVKVRKDPWAFAILFYLGTIALFSNIFFLMGTAMGERLVFFASAGFCMLVALAIDKWLLKEAPDFSAFTGNKMVVGLVTGVCLLFSYLTYARNQEWVDNATLFTKDLEKSPENGRLNYYVGNELVENVLPTIQDTAKRREVINEGISHLKKAIEIFPKYTDAYTELGTAYLNLTQYDSAEKNFKIAISQSPYQSIAANNLGTVYLRQNRIPEAIEAYRLAIQIKADFVQAWCNLGTCYGKVNQFDSAIMAFNQCLAYNPGYVEAYMQAGLAFYFANKYTEAEPYFKKVLELTPNDVNAANNLGAVYLNAGRLPEAINIFKQLVAANPGYVNGYSNLAHAYFQMKDYPNTIDMVNKSLQADPNNVKDIPYIALCYQAMGQMEEARKYEKISQQYYPAFKLQ